MVQIDNDDEGITIACLVLDDSRGFNQQLKEQADTDVFEIKADDMTLLIEMCYKFIPPHRNELRNKRQTIIYPGTNWCGNGDVAENYDDLGSNNETDACCREHDHCPTFIEAFATDFDLKNPFPFTINHCDCDAEFYQCLKDAENQEKSAKGVGNAFFNILKMPCLRLIHPTECLKRFGPICVERGPPQNRTVGRFGKNDRY
ncbi:hypothetical protein ScPMuIL_005439 [Solemya velum]